MCKIECISLPVLYSHNFIYILVAVKCYGNDIERMHFYSHPKDPKPDDMLGVYTIPQQLAPLGFTFHLHQRNIKTHNDVLCSRQLSFGKCMCDVSWCSLASCPWLLYILLRITMRFSVRKVILEHKRKHFKITLGYIIFSFIKTGKCFGVTLTPQFWFIM